MAIKMISVTLNRGKTILHGVSPRTNTASGRCKVTVCAMTLSESQPSHPKAQTLLNESLSFLIGQTQVTQEQWQAVMGENPSHFIKGTEWSDCLNGYSSICSDIGGDRNKEDPKLQLSLIHI